MMILGIFSACLEGYEISIASPMCIPGAAATVWIFYVGWCCRKPGPLQTPKAGSCPVRSVRP